MQKFMQNLKTKKDSMLESIKNREGFTLIELIVVMAIIAILVLLAAPQFLGYTKDANVAALRQDAKVLSDAALQYNIDEVADGATGVDAWPVAEAVDSESVPTEIEADLSTAAVHKINKGALDQYVKDTKYDETEFGIVVTPGHEHEGTVIHLEGLEDRDGDTVHGVGEDFVVSAESGE